MDSNIKSNTSFWSEITEYRIQVPYYQRDYAQGRIDNGRIDNIRKVFVEEMYRAIMGFNNKECHLGLVFGSYDENEKVFIAVDGQQRLTTVFLLHWYVAKTLYITDKRVVSLLLQLGHGTTVGVHAPPLMAPSCSSFSSTPSSLATASSFGFCTA